MIPLAAVGLVVLALVKAAAERARSREWRAERVAFERHVEQSGERCA